MPQGPRTQRCPAPAQIQATACVVFGNNSGAGHAYSRSATVFLQLRKPAASLRTSWLRSWTT